MNFRVFFFAVSFFLRLRKRRINNGECQIHQKERADEYHAEEVQADPDRVSLLV